MRGGDVRPPRAPWAVMVPIDELRQWLQILVAHSRWASEHQHDYLAMTDDWLMAIKLAQQTCRSHLLMSRQWACSMESLTAKEMRLVAREGSAVVDALQLSKSANLAWGEPMTMEKSIEAGADLHARDARRSLCSGRGRLAGCQRAGCRPFCLPVRLPAWDPHHVCGT